MSTAHQPLQNSAASPAPVPQAATERRDPLVWLALGLAIAAVVGAVVYLGYRHPSVVAPVGLGLTAVGVLTQFVKWLANRSR
ncbi:hypothetical protein [Streptomyces sp. NPDC020817]|uniref:hypothetical protein n=1 Tax=Streptomyces sp. NPDC020817 TaxID=3365095 RepID=UPI0037B6273C